MKFDVQQKDNVECGHIVEPYKSSIRVAVHAVIFAVVSSGLPQYCWVELCKRCLLLASGSLEGFLISVRYIHSQVSFLVLSCACVRSETILGLLLFRF